MSATAWMITGLALLSGGGAVTAALALIRSGRHDDGGRDAREAEHAATLPVDPPPVAIAALTPDALPDGAVPVVPGPSADPGQVIADAVEHLASAQLARWLDLGDQVAAGWETRATDALTQLTAPQLVAVLLTELGAAAADRADQLLTATPAHPQES